MILLVALSIFSGNELVVNWQPPTEYTDGTPITKPIMYKVYVTGKEPILNATTTRVWFKDIPDCKDISVTAIVDGIESKPAQCL